MVIVVVQNIQNKRVALNLAKDVTNYATNKGMFYYARVATLLAS
jgi:hypothetical protein